MKKGWPFPQQLSQRLWRQLNHKQSCAGLLALVLAGCASQPSSADLLAEITAAGLAPEQVALSIVPLSPQRHPQNPAQPLHYRSQALMQPASTLKLVTTSAAFAQLGLRWRGETQLLVAKSDLPNLASGRLLQPLIVRGLADYDLDYATLFELLQQLHARGIRQLDGGIFIDRSLFAEQAPAKQPFDESPQAYYNYQPDALPLGRNMLQVRVDSRQSSTNHTADSADILLIPNWQPLVLKSELVLQNTPCQTANTNGWQWQYMPATSPTPQQNTAQGQNPQATLVVRGHFPRNCLFERSQAVFSPEITLELALRNSWQQLTGTNFATLTFGKTPENYQLLARHYSRPLPQLIHQLNKESDNGLAQLLFQRLANPSAQATDLTLAQAEQQVLLWLGNNQINTTGMRLDNGSGLSRTALLSTAQMAEILAHSWQQPWAAEFIASLPLAGQDGTIRRRFSQTPVVNQARLKTGTLRNVTAVAGYVWDQQQRPYAFVAIVNADNASSAGRPLIDRWVSKLVQQN